MSNLSAEQLPMLHTFDRKNPEIWKTIWKEVADKLHLNVQEGQTAQEVVEAYYEKVSNEAQAILSAEYGANFPTPAPAMNAIDKYMSHGAFVKIHKDDAAIVALLNNAIRDENFPLIKFFLESGVRIPFSRQTIELDPTSRLDLSSPLVHLLIRLIMPKRYSLLFDLVENGLFDCFPPADTVRLLTSIAGLSPPLPVYRYIFHSPLMQKIAHSGGHNVDEVKLAFAASFGLHEEAQVLIAQNVRRCAPLFEAHSGMKGLIVGLAGRDLKMIEILKPLLSEDERKEIVNEIKGVVKRFGSEPYMTPDYNRNMNAVIQLLSS